MSPIVTTNSSPAGRVRRVRGAVVAPPSGDFVTDVAALPSASRQQPDWAWYVANVKTAAGNTAFTDPVFGHTLLKATSASYPVANSNANHDYSAGGPQISMGWGTNSLNATTVLSLDGVGRRLVDLMYDATTPTVGNWRTPAVTITSDLMFGFSRVDAQVMYVVNGGYLRKVNTETNTEITGGLWPKDLSAYVGASAFNWLQVAHDDAAFGMGRQDKGIWLVWYPGTDTVYDYTDTELEAGLTPTPSFDEAYLSNDGNYAQVVCGSIYQRKFLDLRTGFATAQGPNNQFPHAGAFGDSSFAASNPADGLNPFMLWTAAAITVDGQAAPSMSTLTSGVSGADAQHTCGYFERAGALTEQYACVMGTNINTSIIDGATWSVFSGNIYKATNFYATLGAGYQANLRGVNDIWEKEGTGGTDAIVRTLAEKTSTGAMTEGSFYYDGTDLYVWATGGGEPDGRHVLSGHNINNNTISLVKLDGSEILMQQFGYSRYYDGYLSLPRPHISPNGVWTMWTTDHGDPDGRLDVLIHVNPVVAA